MTEQMSVFDAISTAINGASDVAPAPLTVPEGTIFVGSGDSLSSALYAQLYGHRAISSGDIAWSGKVPEGARAVVGISGSGWSGATVKSLELARAAGCRTVAITSSDDSPLVDAADDVYLLKKLDTNERLPAAAYIHTALAVIALCGGEVANARTILQREFDRQVPVIESVAQSLDARPNAVTLLSLPELRIAVDYWALKVMEGAGLGARVAPLEECGHVDYFIGPEEYLTLQLIGEEGNSRWGQLGSALEVAGHTVRPVELGQEPVANDDERNICQIAAGVSGAYLLDLLATRWNRPPFRGGQVPLGAKHLRYDSV